TIRHAQLITQFAFQHRHIHRRVGGGGRACLGKLFYLGSPNTFPRFSTRGSLGGLTFALGRSFFGRCGFVCRTFIFYRTFSGRTFSGCYAHKKFPPIATWELTTWLPYEIATGRGSIPTRQWCDLPAPSVRAAEPAANACCRICLD